MDFKVPFFKVTLVFQRYFLNRSLIEYLNCDFKELTHNKIGRSLLGILSGHMSQRRLLSLSQGAWGSVVSTA